MTYRRSSRSAAVTRSCGGTVACPCTCIAIDPAPAKRRNAAARRCKPRTTQKARHDRAAKAAAAGGAPAAARTRRDPIPPEPPNLPGGHARAVRSLAGPSHAQKS